MCTVTYLPINHNEFILTSNRDVPFSRAKALLPKKYIENGIELNYPKDGMAGGSWIGSSSKNRVLCVLNGGFKNHKRSDNYQKSRGIILIELLKFDQIDAGLTKINLENIEPFTLIVVDWNDDLSILEFVWDGNKKHIKNLGQVPHIWSSSTLYAKEVKQMRRKWFTDWCHKNDFEQKNILNFHHNAGIGNPEIDVLMKRKNVGTVSITSIVKGKHKLTMDYEPIEN